MEIEKAQKILELPPEADLKQVKKAYRRLAFKFHPDLNPDKPDAVSRFQEINKAYILLKQVSSTENKGPEPPPESAREKPGKKERSRKQETASDSGYARGKHRQKFHFRQ
jgi:molecular chaperone DnaJ